MNFFIPFWWDHVYNDFDEWQDEWTGGLEHHKYLWELNEIIPFDGILFSRVQVEKSKKKLEKLQEAGGIRKFLRIPEEIPLFGDCGAFGYIEEEEPPYGPIETMKFYERMGYDLACTVDHLIVPSEEDSKEKRFEIVLDNAKEMLGEYKKENYSYDLVGVAQGWGPDSYRKAVRELGKMGFDYIAIGGMVRAKNEQLRDVLKACYPIWNKYDMKVHLFGVASWNMLPMLKKLGVSSIDNAYHRSAWLSKKYNYELKGDRYTAVRVPYSDPYSHDKSRIDEEQEVFDRLKDYTNGDITPKELVEKIKEYEETLKEKKDRKTSFEKINNLEDEYMRTLVRKPWEKCSCHICDQYGVHVAIFRGNERNMRRGFHNCYNFYDRLGSLMNKEIDYTKDQKEFIKPRRIGKIEKKTYPDNTLVITSCTSKKSTENDNIEMKSKNLYTGRIFRKARKLAESMGWDYKIISAKYGLLDPHVKIKSYNKRLSNKSESVSLRPKVLPDLTKLLHKYESFLVLAGKRYREVIEPIMDDRFFVLDSEGYGDLCSKVDSAIPSGVRQKELFDFTE